MYNINDMLDMHDTITYGLDIDRGIISIEDIGIDDLEIDMGAYEDMEASEGESI